MSFRNKSVMAHQFAMVPRADIPRAAFNIDFTHKTTFDAGYLIPIFCEEVLPGDAFKVHMTAFARLATPIFPIMDNLHMDTFFFFVPNRLVWSNWTKFMGEQENPDDSTSFVVPQHLMPAGGYVGGSIQDYFGLPTVGQVDPAGTGTFNALPLRAYNLIWNEWFRDQNLQDSIPVLKGDLPDPTNAYFLQRRGKRADYFTSALPWPQKGESVTLPLGGFAPVVTDGTTPKVNGSGSPNQFNLHVGLVEGNTSPVITPVGAGSGDAGSMVWVTTGMKADLSQATAATINQLRQSFQIQKLLERDARGGTRYTEIVRSHFGVLSPDARLQRPEYLGGSSVPVSITPVAQTSPTGTYAETPQGNVAGFGTVVARSSFSQSFTEHGYIIGLVSVRADLTYQQGVRKHWIRSTRYDFYFPAFAMLGEQVIYQGEIYYRGVSSEDTKVFGYQERWSEYRYSPSMITGKMRSTDALTLDAWHLAQNFTAAPVLGAEFIQETPPLERVLAVGAEAGGSQFIFDSVFKMRAVRPMPVYSVPGLIDHF